MSKVRPKLVFSDTNSYDWLLPIYDDSRDTRTHMPRLAKARAQLAWLGILLLPSVAAAVNATVEMRRLLHTSWVEASGSPMGVVSAFDQGADGYLWVATSKGLLRFDGSRFSTPPLRGSQAMPAESFHSVLAARDGSVWGSGKGRVFRLRDRTVTQYVEIESGPTPGYRDVLEDAAGAIWVLTVRRLARIAPGDISPTSFSARDGLPESTIESIALGGRNDLWLGMENGLCRWKPGSRADCRRVDGTVVAIVAAGPDDVYAATPMAVFHFKGAEQETLLTLKDRVMAGRAFLVDRGGSIWVGTTKGVVRLRRGQTEFLTRTEGLSSDGVRALYEDHEGNVWIGTMNGIDRLRNPRVLHVSTVDGLSGDMVSAVAPARDGGIWIGTSGNGLNRWDGERVTVYSREHGLPGKTVQSIYTDKRGDLWVSTNHGVARLDGGRFVPVSVDRGDTPEGVFGMSTDAAGSMWLADQHRGAFRVSGLRASAVSGLPFEQIFRVLGTRDGAVWLGTFATGAVRLRDGQTEVFDAAKGVGPGPVRALYEDRGGAVWIGSGLTLTRIRAGQRTTWGPRERVAADEVDDIAEDAAGNLWIACDRSVVRLPRADLDGTPDGKPGVLHAVRYDGRDGLRLTGPGMGFPRIAATADGRVWVGEQDGVAIFEPELLRPNSVPPPVSIEQVTVDGAPLAWGAQSYRGHELRITYAGVSLAAPERVRYQYRLEPGAKGWTDMDTNNVITFVNLPPDRYRFHVLACNLDDVCNEKGAAMDFRVDPYYYQTLWFKLLAAMSLGLVVAGVYKIRLAQMKTRFQLVAQERARLTREIHDSLLQGFAGVAFQLDAAARQFDTNPTQSKERLQRALTQADNSMEEARKMLLDMRLPVLEDKTLPEALEAHGLKATEGTATAFSLRTRGAVEPLSYPAQAAMFLIAREAINNSANHAEASRITVHLVYRDREFRMTIQDDGAGFDPVTTKKTGHFGVASMAERAHQVGAEFEIDSAPGKGTTIRVSVARKKA
jgi:signal transduction histidine kinase/ligand-binding sensor domain-containing protein